MQGLFINENVFSFNQSVISLEFIEYRLLLSWHRKCLKDGRREPGQCRHGGSEGGCTLCAEILRRGSWCAVVAVADRTRSVFVCM